MPKLTGWSLFSPEKHQTRVDKEEGYFRVVRYKCSLKSNRVAFTDFSRHWMRSLKIKGCNYISLAAVNLSLKQIILLVSFFCLPEKSLFWTRKHSFGIGSLQRAKKSCYGPSTKHLRYLPGSFGVGKLIFRAILLLKAPGKGSFAWKPHQGLA